MSSREFLRMSKEMRIKVMASLKAFENLQSVLKTQGGHIEREGQDVISLAVAKGFKNSEIAEMFDVSRSAISNQINHII